MKRNSLLIAVLMAITALFASVISIGFSDQSAKAFSSDYNGEDRTIYYFYDYYPSVDEETLVLDYNTYNVVYDYMRLNEADFNNLVINDYFYPFGADCVVIIDIKTFMPDPSVLSLLFDDLKNTQQCLTVFVTPYEICLYPDQTFATYLDILYVSNLEGLKYLVNETFYQTQSYINTWENVTILIDGRFADVNAYYGDRSALIDASPFLQILLSKFKELEHTLWGDIDNLGESYDDIAWNLTMFFNIRLLVHDNANDRFIDIVNWLSLPADSYGSLEGDDRISWDYIFAMGMWRLESGFYDFLYDAQSQSHTINTYIFEVNPITYSANGLLIERRSGIEHEQQLSEDNSGVLLNDLLGMLLG